MLFSETCVEVDIELLPNGDLVIRPIYGLLDGLINEWTLDDIARGHISLREVLDILSPLFSPLARYNPCYRPKQ